MKKILTTAIAALGVMTAAQAQLVQYDIAVSEIIYPAENQSFDCEDIIYMEWNFENKAATAFDITGDTSLKFAPQSSIDTIIVVSSSQVSRQFYSRDSIKIEPGQKLNIKTREILVKNLGIVEEVAGGPRDIYFRTNGTSGQYKLEAFHAGVGKVDYSTNTYEELGNYEDTDSTNDRMQVLVNLCDVSIRNINANTVALSVYPNPAQNGVINFDYNFSANEVATVNVMDVTGRTVLTQSVKGNAGVQNVSLDIANLNAGMYNLEITTANGRGVSKFTVAK